MIDFVAARIYGVSPNTASQADKRLELLGNLQEVVEALWYDSEWPWRWTHGTVSVPLDASGDPTVPSGFSNFGSRGGLFRSDGVPLQERDIAYIEGLRQAGYTTNTPTVFAMGGQSSTTGAQTIRLPKRSSTYTLTTQHLTEAPTMAEGATPDSLVFIPARWHDVVKLGFVALASHEFGDARYRARLQDKSFQDGLRSMRINERPGQTRRALFPRFLDR